jgi:hypothetical protein
MVGYPLAYAKTMQWYDRQMSAMQRNRDCSPPVPQSRAQWRNRFVIHLHGHLKDTKTAADLRRTIIQGIESWFITGDTNDLTAVRSPSKSVGFKSLKDTYQKIGHQCKKASIEVKGVTAKDLYRQAMDERTYRVLLDARQRPGRSVRWHMP